MGIGLLRYDAPEHLLGHQSVHSCRPMRKIENREGRERPVLTRCGHHGGRRADGKPCRRRVSEAGKRCPHHPRSGEGEPTSAGRPRIKLTTEEVGRVETLAGFGLTQAEISQVLPIAERTLRLKMTENPDFRAAYERGRAKAKARAAGRYHQIAFGRAVALGLSEGETVPVSEQRRALRHILESGLEYKRAIEHSGKTGGGAVHVYLPSNDRDDLPKDVRDRVAKSRRNGGG